MSIWKWIGGIFHSLKVKIAPVVVSILEIIKGAEDDGIIDGIAAIIDKATGGHVVSDVNAKIKVAVYNGIAVFLAIEGLPENPTDDQIKAFVSAATVALAGKVAADSVKGKAYQDLSIKLYDIIRKEIDAAKVSGSAITANEIAADIEEAYQDYLAALAQIKEEEANNSESQ